MMDPSVNALFRERYERNWYLSARAEVLTACIRRRLDRQDTPRVADFGAGTGKILAGLGMAVAVALEEHEELADIGRRRYCLPVVRANLEEGIPIRDGVLSLVLMLDVLEHLDDDRRVLREAFRTLRPGGQLVATVPAFRSLWSRHDELHRHRRRYLRGELLDAVTAAGFLCEWSTYYNTLLFPIVCASRLLERLSAAWAASSTDYDRVPTRLEGAFEWIFRQERWLLARWRLPVGVSLLVLARKPPRVVETGCVDGAGRRRPASLASG